MTSLLVLLVVVFMVWYLYERRSRKTHQMPPGLCQEITLPHEQEWELYHNDFSLCSKKIRVCLSELGIQYRSHHIDLIETGRYQNISRKFLAVNPSALVPVLVHNGHPIYESHEQLAYAAEHSATPRLLVPEKDQEIKLMEHWIEQGSLIGDDPIAGLDVTMANAIPGLTLPIFATMIERIPVHRILEGLLFHRIKFRAVFFLILKLLGPVHLDRLSPAVRVMRASKDAMHRHLDLLEQQLGETGPWIVGDQFTLADVGMMVIFDRLDEVDWLEEFLIDERPQVRSYFNRLKTRDSYQEGIVKHGHETIIQGKSRIEALKRTNPEFADFLAA